MTIKRLIARALANEITGAIISLVLRDRIPVHGLVIDTRSTLIANRVKAHLLLGMYESAERRMITRYLRHDLPAVELGSSLGYISAVIGKHGVPSQLAVEANPRLLPLIESSLKDNGVQGAQLIHAAIDYSSRAMVQLRLGATNTDSAIARETDSFMNGERVHVPTTTLGMILQNAAIGDYTLVCDIEGSELGLIVCEEPSVIDRCKQMVIELHDCMDHPRSPMSKDEMAREVCSRWGMHRTRRDGNVWLFERE